jgi:hypothetical protein
MVLVFCHDGETRNTYRICVGKHLLEDQEVLWEDNRSPVDRL